MLRHDALRQSFLQEFIADAYSFSFLETVPRTLHSFISDWLPCARHWPQAVERHREQDLCSAQRIPQRHGGDSSLYTRCHWAVAGEMHHAVQEAANYKVLWQDRKERQSPYPRITGAVFIKWKRKTESNVFLLSEWHALWRIHKRNKPTLRKMSR